MLYLMFVIEWSKFLKNFKKKYYEFFYCSTCSKKNTVYNTRKQFYTNKISGNVRKFKKNLLWNQIKLNYSSLYSANRIKKI